MDNIQADKGKFIGSSFIDKLEQKIKALEERVKVLEDEKNKIQCCRKCIKTEKL